ncbi:mitochondrial ribonuclease P protein 1 homolog, partial [Argonauta hians]
MALKLLCSQLPLQCSRAVNSLLQLTLQTIPGCNTTGIPNLSRHLFSSNVRLCAQLAAPGVKECQMSAAEKIENLNEDMKKKLKILQLEYEVLKQLGAFRIPEKMTDKLWLEMLDFPTSSARRRHYRYLRKIEVSTLAKELKKKKKAMEQQQAAAAAVVEENGEVVPGQSEPKTIESMNTIFMFVRKSTMNKFYYSRMAHSMVYGQPIIFDMSYEKSMRKQDICRLSEQFLMCYGSNKIHQDPFHFVLSSNESTSLFQNFLDNSRRNKDEEYFMMTNSDQHYLDLYPKENLVYLTPDAPSVLKKFDHNAIYIIGGLVDKVNPKPLTLAKAKRERLKMAKLPLDNYIRWGCGNKSLTLNQVIDILLHLKNGSDWLQALQHIPQRKIRHFKR